MNELKAALARIGGLSEPSKMPCFGYSLPAKDCITGSKLREVEGSVCSKCYAMSGFYTYPNVRIALEYRLNAINEPTWVPDMVFVIRNKEFSGYFRWLDSGDVQKLEHLEKIAEIARQLPKIKFWLPTKEYGFVGDYVKKHGKFPKNLIVRLSGFMINSSGPTMLAKKLGVVTSAVTTDKMQATCPSSDQGDQCLRCRQCWDSKKEVTYLYHGPGRKKKE